MGGSPSLDVSEFIDVSEIDSRRFWAKIRSIFSLQSVLFAVVDRPEDEDEEDWGDRGEFPEESRRKEYGSSTPLIVIFTFSKLI